MCLPQSLQENNYSAHLFTNIVAKLNVDFRAI